MKIITDPSQPAPGSDPHAVTIGVFDGVHAGHCEVLAQTRRTADDLGAALALVTFDPHPASVLRPETAPAILTSLDQKLELLEAAGVDTTVVITFDRAQAEQTAEGFVKDVLVGCLRAQSVTVGADFHFGRRREGNVDVLTAWGDELGFAVRGIEQVARPDGVSEPISSTAVRRALAGGDVRTVAELLGRLHQVRGTVVEGDKRGRTIGFPTANVAVPPHIALPADAVYAAWYLRPDGSRHPAAVNVGKRPTFYQDAEASIVEAHLIDFSADLYGEVANVEFVELLRSEQRFDGLEALKEQLTKDIQHAIDVLGAP